MPELVIKFSDTTSYPVSKVGREGLDANDPVLKLKLIVETDVKLLESAAIV